MTTDTELHDLLTSEAGGPTSGPGGWNDVQRRGRHRRRVRRVQTTVLATLVVGVAITDVVLSAGDSRVETVPPATDPTTSLPDVTTTSLVTSPVRGNPSITAARAQGAFVTVILPAQDPSSGFDPCTDIHPRVPEAPEQVLVELVDETVERGRPWAACQSSPFSAWGTIELTDPLGDRPLLDVITGVAVPVIDGGELLFPTELPDPFDLTHWDEQPSLDTAGDGWTFSWTNGDLFVSVTTSFRDPGACDEPVEVRGVSGCLEPGDGVYLVRWEEGGAQRSVELGVVDPQQPSAFTLDDALSIAEGLEPLDV